MKKAIITGVTGQDGALLSRFLLNKGYEVHGLRRRSSLPNIDRIQDLIEPPQEAKNNFFLHYADLTDGMSLTRLLHTIQPTEVYNLGAQSHVHVSFDTPEYTANVNALGALRLVEAIKDLGLIEKTKFYQASTSELYGKIQSPKQNENTPFYPRSPYAISKLFAYWTVVNYREAYGLFGCNGILFNHESPSRDKSFVTRKITDGLARVVYGLQNVIYLGNLDAQRDWGHAQDYIEMQWLMLQQDTAEDYVIATGQKRSVRCFIECACKEIGFTLKWAGSDVDEVGFVDDIDHKQIEQKLGIPFPLERGDKIIAIDPFYYRPTEVDVLWGCPQKAQEKLGWKPRISFEELVSEMVVKDLSLINRERRYNSPCIKRN